MPGANVSPAAKLFLSMLLVAALSFFVGACGGGGNSSNSKEKSSNPGSPTKSTLSPAANSASGASTGFTKATSSTSTGMASKTVQLSPSRNSGVSGKATFTDTKGGLRVELSMKDLGMNKEKPGTEHLAHIHQPGTCGKDRAGNGAPVQYSLKPLYTRKNGNGTSVTVIKSLTLSRLFSGPPKYVNVHAMKKGSSVPPGISCGDISNILGG